jgi:exopolysaccharide production protein ExoY
MQPVYRIEQPIAVIALIIVFPFAAMLAVAIYILSGRGPLIRHARVGRYGAPLYLLKFRTMWSAAEPGSPFFSIEDVSRNDVPLSKRHVDSRIGSRFAAFCRRYSLDEIPQLWHVARGEMSLVGPRPVTARELEIWYGASAAAVLALRPGLSGLWQVTGRSRLTYAQRRRLDVFLVRRASARLYLLILARTIAKVAFGEGAC